MTINKKLKKIKNNQKIFKIKLIKIKHNKKI